MTDALSDRLALLAATPLSEGGVERAAPGYSDEAISPTEARMIAMNERLLAENERLRAAAEREAHRALAAGPDNHLAASIAALLAGGTAPVTGP